MCVVEEQELNVHSVILCARSEVFKAQLLGGMREAVDKRIVVEDIDLVTFQALLKFLYTDDLIHVEDWTKSVIATSEGDAPPQRKRVAVL